MTTGGGEVSWGARLCSGRKCLVHCTSTPPPLLPPPNLSSSSSSSSLCESREKDRQLPRLPSWMCLTQGGFAGRGQFLVRLSHRSRHPSSRMKDSSLVYLRSTSIFLSSHMAPPPLGEAESRESAAEGESQTHTGREGAREKERGGH